MNDTREMAEAVQQLRTAVARLKYGIPLLGLGLGAGLAVLLARQAQRG